MKLNPDFIMQEIGGEAMLVPIGAAAEKFRGLVRLNETAAFIVRRLQNETDPAALIAAMGEEYDGTAEQHAGAVQTTLSKLREVGALIE